MSANDNFCLRLNSFDENVKRAWKEMQMEEDFCDMTLACQDKQIKTHKLIISSYSPVLRTILKSTQNPHPFIHLRSVQYKHLQNLLTFMYQGQVDVAEEDLRSFLEVAEDLNIRGLSEGNMEAYNSNEEDPSNFAHSNFDSSHERNGHTETYIKLQSTNDLDSSHSITEYEKSDERFLKNDNVSNSVFVPTEKERNIKQTYNKDIKQNIVSTLSGNQFNCEKCDKQFSSHPGLRFHSKSVHEGVFILLS